MAKNKDGRTKNGNKDIAQFRPETPREKKFIETGQPVMISFKVEPSTAKLLRDYAKNSFPKPRGGYGSLIEQLIRHHFGADTVLDFPPDDD